MTKKTHPGKQIVAAWLTAEEYAALRARADAEDRDMAYILRKALRKLLGLEKKK